jgi:hypothetical protein
MLKNKNMAMNRRLPVHNEPNLPLGRAADPLVLMDEFLSVLGSRNFLFEIENGSIVRLCDIAGYF